MNEKLNEPECYINKIDGSLFIIWWAENRPPDNNEWVQISRRAYDNLYNAIFKVRQIDENTKMD